MDINVDELDYSKYKLPYDISEDDFKRILKCSYEEAIQLTVDELIEVIDVLRIFIFRNKYSEDYGAKEWYSVVNMESNYRHALAVVKGEIK